MGRTLLDASLLNVFAVIILDDQLSCALVYNSDTSCKSSSGNPNAEVTE